MTINEKNSALNLIPCTDMNMQTQEMFMSVITDVGGGGGGKKDTTVRVGWYTLTRLMLELHFHKVNVRVTLSQG